MNESNLRTLQISATKGGLVGFPVTVWIVALVIAVCVASLVVASVVGFVVASFVVGNLVVVSGLMVVLGLPKKCHVNYSLKPVSVEPKKKSVCPGNAIGKSAGGGGGVI